jgi:hypothetical protein
MATSVWAPGHHSSEGKTEYPVEFILTNQNTSKGHAGLVEVSNGKLHIAEEDQGSILTIIFSFVYC